MRPKHESCPFCNNEHSNVIRTYWTKAEKKDRMVQVYYCGTEAYFYYDKGKNRAEWIKTCRKSFISVSP